MEMNADAGLGDIRWIHGLGGERLPAASYDLLPNLSWYLWFPWERDRLFLSLVFDWYTTGPKCVCISRLAGARDVSPAVPSTL